MVIPINSVFDEYAKKVSITSATKFFRFLYQVCLLDFRLGILSLRKVLSARWILTLVTL